MSPTLLIKQKFPMLYTIVFLLFWLTYPQNILEKQLCESVLLQDRLVVNSNAAVPWVFPAAPPEPNVNFADWNRLSNAIFNGMSEYSASFWLRVDIQPNDYPQEIFRFSSQDEGDENYYFTYTRRMSVFYVDYTNNQNPRNEFSPAINPCGAQNRFVVFSFGSNPNPFEYTQYVCSDLVAGQWYWIFMSVRTNPYQINYYLYDPTGFTALGTNAEYLGRSNGVACIQPCAPYNSPNTIPVVTWNDSLSIRWGGSQYWSMFFPGNRYRNFDGTMNDVFFYPNYYSDDSDAYFRFNMMFGWQSADALWYEFYEGSGKVVEDTKGLYSGLRNNIQDPDRDGFLGSSWVTLDNTPTWSTDNERGLYFDNTDYIVIPNTGGGGGFFQFQRFTPRANDAFVGYYPGTAFYDTFWAITISFWIKLDVVTGAQSAFVRFETGGAPTVKYRIYFNNQLICFTVADQTICSANNYMNQFEWTFVTAGMQQYGAAPRAIINLIVDRASDLPTLVTGKEQILLPALGDYVESANDVLRIGAGSGVDGFEGYMRHFRITRGSSSFAFDQFCQDEYRDYRLFNGQSYKIDVDPADPNDDPQTQSSDDEFRWLLRQYDPDECTTLQANVTGLGNNYGFYLENGFSRCAICDSRCLTCTSGQNLNCGTCQAGYTPNGSGECECDNTHEWFDVDFQQCRECDFNCERCSGPGDDECLTCSYPRHFYEGECIFECPEGWYAFQDGTNSRCRECDDSCVTCDGPNNDDCKSCVAEDYLFNGKCVDMCPKYGYYPDVVDGEDVCLECHSSCYTCDGPESTDCLSCNGNLVNQRFLLLGECIEDCPEHYYQDLDFQACIECADNNCRECTAPGNDCLECVLGTFLKGTACVTACDPDEYYDNTTRTCEPCDADCLTCDGPYDNQCLTCNPGDFYINSTCVDLCPDHYYNDVGDDACYECNDNCKTCDVIATQCTSCNNNYYLLNFECFEECPDGTYYNNDSFHCDRCHQDCNTCEGGGFYNNCTSCSPGPPYLLDGVCLDSCPDELYYPNATTISCELCEDNCTTCASSTDCTSCPDDFFLYIDPDTLTGDCLEECPFHTIPNKITNSCDNLVCHPYCKSCVDYALCTECVGDLYLYNGTCRQMCPSHTYLTIGTSQKSCGECSWNCSECLGPDPAECTSCFDGYTLHNPPLSRCRPNCAEGEFYDDHFGCLDCHPSCETCTSYLSTDCLSCEDGYELESGECNLITNETVTETGRTIPDESNEIDWKSWEETHAPYVLLAFTGFSLITLGTTCYLHHSNVDNKTKAFTKERKADILKDITSLNEDGLDRKQIDKNAFRANRHQQLPQNPDDSIPSIMTDADSDPEARAGEPLERPKLWRYMKHEVARHNLFLNPFKHQSIKSPSWVRWLLFLDVFMLQGIILQGYLRRENVLNWSEEWVWGSKKFYFSLASVYISIIFLYLLAFFLRPSRADIIAWQTLIEYKRKDTAQEYSKRQRLRFGIFVVFTILFFFAVYYINLRYEAQVGVGMYEEWLQTIGVAFLIDIIGLGVVVSLFMGLAVKSRLKPFKRVERAIYKTRDFRIIHDDSIRQLRN